MRRRSFFGVVAAAVTTCFFPSRAAAAPTPGLKAVYRYSYESDAWTRCRLYEIRAGDVFRFDDDRSLRAHADAEHGSDGIWSIMTDYHIDPATNEWVEG